MIDKLKGLFGGRKDPAAEDDDEGADGGAAPRPRAVARRPVAPRRPRPGGAAAKSRSVGPLTPPSLADVGAEVSCPNCGEPMMAGWGTTCGKCRPAMVGPKTLFGSDAVVAAQLGGQGLVLGWLVVVRSLDKVRAGLLFDLDAPEVVLSRVGAFERPGARVVELDDEYMSGGHAVLRRPRSAAKTDAFTLRDESDPSPSANGTFVNSHKLAATEEMALADGDIIKVGATELLFKSLWLPPSGARGP